jgi:hypothetical protein
MNDKKAALNRAAFLISTPTIVVPSKKPTLPKTGLENDE